MYLKEADASASKYRGWKVTVLLQFCIFSLHVKSLIKTLLGFSFQVIS
jgi:hypothetical protein